jgi:hypothetical protein
LIGLVLGLRVGLEGAAAAAAERVVRLRAGLGETLGGGFDGELPIVCLSGDRFFSGDEKRKRFSVFLFRCSSSSESSSTMARLRRFAGGTIVGDFGAVDGVAFVTLQSLKIGWHMRLNGSVERACFGCWRARVLWKQTNECSQAGRRQVGS